MIRYSVVPPKGAGKPFEARVENGIVMSNRNGEWAEETRLTVADLIMPEQQFIEWDIQPISTVDDAGFNPNQPRDKEGQWTETSGIYAGTSKSTRGKKKTTRHKVFAHSADEAKKIMAERHREEHKLHPSDFIHVGEFQFIGEEKEPPPRPKPPNKGSKEDLFRQEMQRRVDEQKGYKGD